MASNDFSGTLQNSINNFDIECEKFLVRTSNKLMRKVKLKTPVGQYSNGQVGGTLRNNWKNNKTGTRERSIVNNTDYALHVEYGHRTRGGKGFVKGRYMLTKSVEELENEIEADLQNFMDNLWR